MPSIARDPHGSGIAFLSAVIPFYNESESVTPVLWELKRTLDGFAFQFEIIAIDDGSEDGTWVKLSSLKSRIPELRLIRLRGNFGQTRALETGIDHARGDWILTMDGDGQNDPKSLRTLLNEVSHGYDVISGWRKDRKDSAILRTIPSRIANWLLSKITGLKLHDSGCSLKLYRAKALRSISLYSDRHRFIPFLLHMRGFRVAEAVVNHRPRVRGKSKYGLSRTLKVFLDLIGLTLFARFEEAPRFYFFVAAIPFLVGTVISLAVSLSRGAAMVGHPSHVTYFGSTFLLLYGAISLVSYGLLAEWLHRFERGNQ